MDSYDPYRQPSNPTLLSRQQGPLAQARPPPASSDQGGAHYLQQPLPSFKEILPPPLHTAIDSTSQAFTVSAEPSTISNLQQSRPGGLELPSPNYSQSSSMPDSVDDFGHRSQDGLYQVSILPRQPSSLTTTSHFADMAASYSTQRMPYQSHQLGGRHGDGLPPIRDIDHGIGKFNNGFEHGLAASSGGYSGYYNQTVPGGAYYPGRQPLPYDSSRTISQTCPPTNRPYPPIKIDYPNSPYPISDYQYSPRPGDYSSQGHYANAINGNCNLGYPISGDAGDKGNRRRRGNLPKHITDTLRAWFADHLDHPYPSEEEKQMFIQQTGLTMNQISNWFINARRRHLAAMRQARDNRNQGLDESQRQSR